MDDELSTVAHRHCRRLRCTWERNTCARPHVMLEHSKTGLGEPGQTSSSVQCRTVDDSRESDFLLDFQRVGATTDPLSLTQTYRLSARGGASLDGIMLD